MNALVNPRNPARIEGWPSTLPLEIALRVAPVPTICQAYNIDKIEYERLRADPAFREAVRKCSDQLSQGGGVSFKLKAQLMAENLLDKVYDMTHASYAIVPPQVQADMVKTVIKAAGFDGSQDKVNPAGVGNNNLQINIHLSKRSEE